jgi:hypothetical protein
MLRRVVSQKLADVSEALTASIITAQQRREDNHFHTYQRENLKSHTGKKCSLCYRVKTGSEAHTSFYLTGTGGSLLRGDADRARSWPLNSIQCRGQETVHLYLQSPIRLHDVVLNKHQGQHYLYLIVAANSSKLTVKYESAEIIYF